MGLETLLYVALAAGAGHAAGGGFSGKSGKLRMPKLTPLKTPGMKVGEETERARAYLASRARRGGSRAKSRIVMPGYLDPAQVQRPTLSSVLG